MLLRASCNDDHSAFNVRHFQLRACHFRPKVAHAAVYSRDARAGVRADQRIVFDLIDQVSQVFLNVIAFERIMKMTRIATKRVFLFDQVNLKSLTR